jgi:hypothetical protein
MTETSTYTHPKSTSNDVGKFVNITMNMNAMTGFCKNGENGGRFRFESDVNIAFAIQKTIYN